MTVTPASDLSVTPMHHPQDAAIVEAIRARLPDVRIVYRYGSAGGAYEREESDLDIAVLAGHALSLDEKLSLSVALQEICGKEADVNDLRSLPVTLRVQIVTTGARLYASDTAAAEEYASRTLSDYVRLNEERREILEDVRRRGSVYG